MEIMQSKPSADSGICLSVPYQSQSLSENEQEDTRPPGSPGLTMGGLPEINIMAELETMRVRLGRRKSISRDNIDEIGQFLSQTAGLGERTKSTENLPNHLVQNLETEARKSLSDSIESLQDLFKKGKTGMKEKVKDATRLIRKMGEKKKSSPLAEVSTITNQLHRGISHPDGLNFLDEESPDDLKRPKGLRRNISEVNIADKSSGRRVSYEGSTKIPKIEEEKKPPSAPKRHSISTIPAAAREKLLNRKQRRASITPVKMPWTPIDDLTLDDQVAKMIGPIPPSPFSHRKIEIRKLQVAGYNGFKKNIQEEFNVEFKSEYQIGNGRFGKVYRGTSLDNNTVFAFKACAISKSRSLSKAKSRKRDERLSREDVQNEILLMNQINHKNIVKLYDAVEHDCYITLVMEHLEGGELFERLLNFNFDPTELDVVIYMKQICEAVSYLHKNQILHLDLKPENIVCVAPDSHHIKLIDFGLSRRYVPHQKLQVNFGTPEFVSPEVVNYNSVSYASDMWSVGVITYILVSGHSPFLGDDEDETMSNIQEGDWEFCDEFKHVSEDCKDFISRLIVYQKGGRMSANQCLTHPWIKNFAKNRSGQLLSRSKIRRRVNKLRWWKVVDTITAVNFMRRLSQSKTSEACEITDAQMDKLRKLGEAAGVK